MSETNQIKENMIDIVARHAALNQMRKMKPEDVNKVDPDFVISYIEDTTDDKGVVTSNKVYEINWYYALFTATMYKIDKLFAAFQPHAKKDIVKKEPDLFVPTTKIIV